MIWSRTRFSFLALDVFAPGAIRAAPATLSHARVSTGAVFLSLLVYFALHVVFRVLASGTIELDEAEQVLLAQDLRWGYGAQPPLYTWLQIGFFRLFGQNVLALSLLKHLLLFGTFAFTYSTARLIANDEQTPVLAMLALLFVPQFAWESHRDLTHSVAATAFAAATLFFVVRLIKFRRPLDYGLLGIVAGMGVLAKYNFAIFLIALLATALSMRSFRGGLKSVWMLAAVGTFVLVTAGHFAWLLEHGASPGTRDVARTHLAALRYWFMAVVSFSAFLLIAMAILRFKTRGVAMDPMLKMLGRTLLVALGLSLVVVILWKARFKDRWFQPILFALPLCFALWARPRLSAKGIRFFYGIGAAIATATLFLVPAIPLGAQVTNRPTRLNLPYAALASTLRKEGVTPTAIAADSRLTGGNLKLHFPSATVTVPELRRPLPERNQLLVIWEAKRKGQPPNGLVQLVQALGISRENLARAAYLELPLQFMADEKARWGYVFVTER